MSSKIQIIKSNCCYEKEPLKTAFGFKGSALTGLWQTVVRLETDKHTGIGVGVQSVLWSDAAVYHEFGEEIGNQMMFELTEYAVRLCEGMAIEHPFELIDAIFPEVYSYAKVITKTQNLRKTFVLNSLVPLDFAMWQLWAKENSKAEFDNVCTFDGKHQTTLANIPLITYNMPIEDVSFMAENGTALFKIKIGSDPLKNNDLDAMLSWDKNRIAEIHNAVKDIRTPYTENGNILYYLDANGRYDTKERLESLLDFVKSQGILDRIVLLEEPFDEQNKVDVSNIPVCVAADESAHSLEDVKERFELGYRALTLKPIAKTLSMTIRMADYARKQGMICFCADLTVNPVMVSWNQCVAARLNPIPQMRIGVMESNGDQNYTNWEKMRSYHPLCHKSFNKCENGVFSLGEEFYKQSGGVFHISPHYDSLAKEADNRDG
ncbi:MAG: L-alanine-DL-glutamate epimerase [Clostridia bacterium]|nr:L-alanine-DL-glutamate epimerase [Clostridia bacterium]